MADLQEMNCLWCGKLLPGCSPRQRKYCSHSHQQMAWEQRHHVYRQRQNKLKLNRKSNWKVRMSKKLTIIVTGMVLEQKRKTYADIEKEVKTA
jgi:hypothetical protein